MRALMLWLMAVAVGACASGGYRSKIRAVGDDPVLLTSSGAMEIQVRDGKILQMVPAARPGERERWRQITSLEELRTLYQQASGTPLPSQGADGTLLVNGWSGLECVRLGHACGRAPEDMPGVMVLIRVEP